MKKLIIPFFAFLSTIGFLFLLNEALEKEMIINCKKAIDYCLKYEECGACEKIPSYCEGVLND